MLNQVVVKNENSFHNYDKMTTLDFVGAYDPLTQLKTMDL